MGIKARTKNHSLQKQTLRTTRNQPIYTIDASQNTKMHRKLKSNDQRRLGLGHIAKTDLRRDAADVEAGTTEGTALLDTGGLEAELRRLNSGDVTAGTAADNDDVVVIGPGGESPARVFGKAGKVIRRWREESRCSSPSQSCRHRHIVSLSSFSGVGWIDSEFLAAKTSYVCVCVCIGAALDHHYFFLMFYFGKMRWNILYHLTKTMSF